MGNRAVAALRTVIALALVGSVVVQVVMLPLLWIDMEDTSTGIRSSLIVIGVLGIASLQVVAMCIWRLLSKVRQGTVFSYASFRYVDIVIGAIVTTSVLVFGVAVVARSANLSTPGDEVAPGVVALICGLSLVLGGVALVVYVLRMLLAQAVDLDSEARHLQSELDAVI